MPRNKLTDLNDHLFAQIEKLNDPDLTGDKLKEEIARSKAMAGLATPIVNSSKTFVEALKMIAKNGGDISKRDIAGILQIADK